MNILLLVLFDLFVVWFFFGQALKRWLSPAWLKPILGLRDIERHYRHTLRRDRDVLPDDLVEEIGAAAEGLRIARKRRGPDGKLLPEVRDALGEQACFAGFADAVEQNGFTAAATGLVDDLHEGKVGPTLPGRKRAWLGEHLEIAVVALGLAFGVRALFLQPFKIPTGSMQPTLYGIHFIHTETGAPKFGPVGRFFGYLHYSRRYVDITAQKAGYLQNLREVRRPIPLANWLLPVCRIDIGGVGYELPGSKEVVEKYLAPVIRERVGRLGPDRARYYEAGELFLRGHLELGDHLFVDRTYLPFHEPKRGDVTVFRTDNVRYTNGGKLNGPYYVKRLVGMPGDELKIVDQHVQVRRPEESEFHALDEKDHPGFGRVYSWRGGYRGHTHAGGFCLGEEGEVFYVPRQGDLLKIDPRTRDCWIRKVDGDDFVPYQEHSVGVPILQQGVRETLAWMQECGWFDKVEDNVFRFRYDHFLMMGDNTTNSSDGRAWGTVPRLNLVGRASLVWWPFTRRWGRTDRLDPLDFPSGSSHLDLPPLGADANE